MKGNECIFCKHYQGSKSKNTPAKCTSHNKYLTREESRHNTCNDFEYC